MQPTSAYNKAITLNLFLSCNTVFQGIMFSFMPTTTIRGLDDVQNAVSHPAIRKTNWRN